MSHHRRKDNPPPKYVGARQNFADDVIAMLSSQINNELYASYQYLAMANFFARTEIALPGATLYFGNQSLEERGHAQRLIDYVHSRGSIVKLVDIKAPTKTTFDSLYEAFNCALVLEQNNNQALLELHGLASSFNDPDLTNFLEEFYLREQVIEIEAMARRCAQLRRVGPGLGEHIVDRELIAEVKEAEKGAKGKDGNESD